MLNKDIGFVHAGQDVTVKLGAIGHVSVRKFPLTLSLTKGGRLVVRQAHHERLIELKHCRAFTRHGTLDGKVQWVSPDAIQDEKLGITVTRTLFTNEAPEQGM